MRAGGVFVYTQRGIDSVPLLSVLVTSEYITCGVQLPLNYLLSDWQQGLVGFEWHNVTSQNCHKLTWNEEKEFPGIPIGSINGIVANS